MEIENGSLYFKKNGEFQKLCDCAESPEVQGKVIKVELSEENLIKPKRIEFENGSVIEIPVNAPRRNTEIK